MMNPNYLKWWWTPSTIQNEYRHTIHTIWLRGNLINLINCNWGWWMDCPRLESRFWLMGWCCLMLLKRSLSLYRQMLYNWFGSDGWEHQVTYWVSNLMCCYFNSNYRFDRWAKSTGTSIETWAVEASSGVSSNWPWNYIKMSKVGCQNVNKDVHQFPENALGCKIGNGNYSESKNSDQMPGDPFTFRNRLAFPEINEPMYDIAWQPVDIKAGDNGACIRRRDSAVVTFSFYLHLPWGL